MTAPSKLFRQLAATQATSAKSGDRKAVISAASEEIAKAVLKTAYESKDGFGNCGQTELDYPVFQDGNIVRIEEGFGLKGKETGRAEGLAKPLIIEDLQKHGMRDVTFHLSNEAPNRPTVGDESPQAPPAPMRLYLRFRWDSPWAGEARPPVRAAPPSLAMVKAVRAMFPQEWRLMTGSSSLVTSIVSVPALKPPVKGAVEFALKTVIGDGRDTNSSWVSLFHLPNDKTKQVFVVEATHTPKTPDGPEDTILQFLDGATGAVVATGVWHYKRSSDSATFEWKP
jgi:hypothetical protein